MNANRSIVEQLLTADAARRQVNARIRAAAEAYAARRDRQRDAVDRLISNRPALDVAALLHGAS